ncbi:hypothetical protein WJX73_003190 [Symbiochloris irregularis]|uniref:Peptidase S32 domain-containing protein n=1 Tax=Symbiochloris irregularis TaxID=706552 RepID=A0AAW1NYB3_9CHLO
MFEGWISELLASYLGHFLDVKKDQLRVSLWRAWSTGLVLENVSLKLDAFDYLELPVAVTGGCVDRLEVQVPWRALRSKPVLVKLSGVSLTVAERPESDWEEGPAGKRASAAKLAQLAALELQALSAPDAPARRSGWSLFSYIGTFLLNTLQLSIANVCVCLQECSTRPGSQPASIITVRLQRLQTVSSTQPASQEQDQPAKEPSVFKEFQIEGFSLSWHDAREDQGANAESNAAVHLLRPLQCSMRLSALPGGTGSQQKGSLCLAASLSVPSLQWHLLHSQVQDIVRLLDKLTVWRLRNKVALLRPNGWRSPGASRPSWRRMWRYAGNAALVSIGKKPWMAGMVTGKAWRQRMRQYMQLYRHKREAELGRAPELAANELAQLKDLEAEPWIQAADLMMVRTMVNRAVRQAPVRRESTDNARQGWLAWSVSGAAGFLGYVPLHDAPHHPDMEMDDSTFQSVVDQLDLGQALAAADHGSHFSVAVQVNVQVAHITLLLTDDQQPAKRDLILLDMQGWKATAAFSGASLSLAVTLDMLTAHDLFSMGPGVSQLLLGRPGAGTHAASATPVFQLAWEAASFAGGGSPCNVQRFQPVRVRMWYKHLAVPLLACQKSMWRLQPFTCGQWHSISMISSAHSSCKLPLSARTFVPRYSMRLKLQMRTAAVQLAAPSCRPQVHQAVSLRFELPLLQLAIDGPALGPDVNSVSLSLQLESLQGTAHNSDHGFTCTAKAKQLIVNDASTYSSSPPKLRGSMPALRLARQLCIDAVSLLGVHTVHNQTLVSAELQGAYAEGYAGEQTSFIRRVQQKSLPTGYLTFHRTSDHLHTAITLQDGCFGIGSLLRIAAIFQPVEKLTPEPNTSRESPRASAQPETEHASTSPAQHPEVHPIQQPAEWTPHALAAHQPRQGSAIFTLTQAVMQIGPMDRSRAAGRLDINRVMTIPSISLAHTAAASGAEAAGPPNLTATDQPLALDIPNIAIAADAEQLSILRKASQWCQAELQQIVGRSPAQPADTASCPPAASHPTSGRSAEAPVHDHASREHTSGSIGSLVITLYGASAEDPYLVCQMRQLSSRRRLSSDSSATSSMLAIQSPDGIAHGHEHAVLLDGILVRLQVEALPLLLSKAQLLASVFLESSGKATTPTRHHLPPAQCSLPFSLQLRQLVLELIGSRSAGGTSAVPVMELHTTASLSSLLNDNNNLMSQVLSHRRKRATVFSASIAKAGLLLSQDSNTNSIPILEFAVLSLAAEAALAHAVLDLSISGELCAYCYSSTKLGWEPLLEPWNANLHLHLGPSRPDTNTGFSVKSSVGTIRMLQAMLNRRLRERLWHCQQCMADVWAIIVMAHSGLQVINWTSIPLRVGLRLSSPEPRTLETLQPEGQMWLPCIRTEPGMLCIKPAGTSETEFVWSPGVRLQPLLDLAQEAMRGAGRGLNAARIARHLACKALLRASASMRFHIGVVENPHAAGFQLVIQAPLMLQNSLPMPVTILLKAPGASHSIYLHPRTQTAMHTIDSNDIIELVVQLLGYQWSSPIRVPHLERARTILPLEASSDGESPRIEEAAETFFKVSESGDSRGSATVYLRHLLDTDCGSHLLRFSCALWVYNCTGFPIALQQSEADEAAGAADQMSVEDEDPVQWVRPYDQASPAAHLSGLASLRSAASGRTASSGLGGYFSPRVQPADELQPTSESRRFRFHQGSGSPDAPAHGMAASIESRLSYTSPTRYASMQGGVQPSKRRLRLRIRASNIRARSGRTFWSAPVALDALGGAAVVMVPYPTASTAAAVVDSPSAYMLAVTAAQVDGGDGALAVHEAGWLWSGGVAISSPGDLFIKIRHRGRGETLMLKVDVSTTKSGPMLVTISHQAAGFTPYRLDNCTSETLHISQHQCSEQEDVLRPYTSLDYAWDEPALPHRLNLALPGNRKLGSFWLDKVGTQATLSLPSKSRADREHRLQVVLRAEGPTRVLSVIDSKVHVHSQLLVSLPVHEQGWEAWSRGSSQAPLSAQSAIAAPLKRQSGSGFAEVRTELAGIGISLVLEQQEMFYARISNVQLRGTRSKVRYTLEAAVASLQVENPRPGAVYTAVVCAPGNTQQQFKLTPRRAELKPASQSPALRMRCALWTRQPAGVLCVEKLELAVAPITLGLEQAYLLDLHEAVTSAVNPLLGMASASRRDEPDLSILAGGFVPQHATEQKVYIERLHISSLMFAVSFLPASWHDVVGRHSLNARGSKARLAGLQRLVALVGEVEGGSIRLALLEMRHPLVGTTALQQQIYSHYMRTAIPELVKLVGSANLLGDPVRLFHHLGLGVWSFLAYPAVGLVDTARGQGPWRIIVGLQEGFSSLLGNIVFAISNATAKTSAAMRRPLQALRLDQGGSSGQRQVLDAPDQGIVTALLRGIAGLLVEPARGAEESGVLGFLRGTFWGIIGALIRPIDGMLDTCARVADSIRTAVMGPPVLASRIRPPRYVNASGPLAIYDWSEAMGRYLLGDVDKRRFAQESFLLCQQLSHVTEFAVLTSCHLLSITSAGLRFLPSLNYSVALQDIIFVRSTTALLLCHFAMPGCCTCFKTAARNIQRPL